MNSSKMSGVCHLELVLKLLKNVQKVSLPRWCSFILMSTFSLGSMARKNDADAALANSIWINKKEDDLKTVDLKKLERASELQLKKQVLWPLTQL